MTDFPSFCISVSQIWGVIEPLVWLSGALAGLIYWLKVRKARKRRFANRNGKKFIIALQIGRSVNEAVKAQFGELDCLIDVNAVLKKDTLESDGDYRTLTMEVYKAMAQNQHCPIKLVLSGPVGLSFLIGQLVGLHHFDVEVFQYNPKTGYKPLPIPDRAWLGR